MKTSAVFPGIVLTLLCVAAQPAVAQSPDRVLRGRLALPPVAETPPRSEHTFTVLRGQRIEVQARSDEFDTILELISPAGDSLWNDDHGSTTNSRITTVATADGVWRAVVSSFDDSLGEYELEVILGDVGASRTIGNAALTDADSVSAKGEVYRSHNLMITRPSDVTVEMLASGFEPGLVLISPRGERYTSEMFGREGSSATVQVAAAEPGEWRVLAASYSGLGSYSLQLYETATDATVQRLTGALAAGHPQQLRGEYFDTCAIEGGAGALVLNLSSIAFDAFLAARSPSGRWFRDDDGGDNNNARLELPAERGTWTVIVTSFGAGETGPWELTITRQRGAGMDAGAAAVASARCGRTEA